MRVKLEGSPREVESPGDGRPEKHHPPRSEPRPQAFREGPGFPRPDERVALPGLPRPRVEQVPALEPVEELREQETRQRSEPPPGVPGQRLGRV